MALPCDSKQAYKTATQAANAARGRKEAGVPYLRVYQCHACGAFHLTSQKPTFKDSIEKKGGA